MGPLVTLGDFMACFPYNDSITRFAITGGQLKHIFNHILRPENRNGEGEFYQVNSGIKAVYSDKKGGLESLSINGKPVAEGQEYAICLQQYHFLNSKGYLDLSKDELMASGKTKTVSTSARDVLEEFLRNNQNVDRKIEGRLVYG